MDPVVKGIYELIREINKEFRDLNKTIDNGFKVLSKNSTSSAKYLKGLCEKETDQWHPLTGPEAADCPPMNTWLLVKLYNNKKQIICETPHISKCTLNSEGDYVWRMLEQDLTYEEMEYSVLFWRPIPL